MKTENQIHVLRNESLVKYFDLALSKDKRDIIEKLTYMAEVNAYDRVLNNKLTFSEIR